MVSCWLFVVSEVKGEVRSSASGPVLSADPYPYCLIPAFQPASTAAISSSVFNTESGLRLMESMPCSTRKRANSG